MTSQTKENNLKVTIRSRTDSLFEGTAYSLTSVNEKGIFDVLPGHANFVSLISQYIILNKNKSGEKKIEIEKGLMSVETDVVNVYVGL